MDLGGISPRGPLRLGSMLPQVCRIGIILPGYSLPLGRGGASPSCCPAPTPAPWRWGARRFPEAESSRTNQNPKPLGVAGDSDWPSARPMPEGSLAQAGDLWVSAAGSAHCAVAGVIIDGTHAHCSHGPVPRYSRHLSFVRGSACTAVAETRLLLPGPTWGQ